MPSWKQRESFSMSSGMTVNLFCCKNIKEGTESNTPEIHKAMLAAMRAAEKRYGKRKLRNYYHNDFEWGMQNGKLSALRWVMGSGWDFLDT
jgi:hypothetical protein